MAIEIERKFLVRSDEWKNQVSNSKRLVQGYLTCEDRTSVRVRIIDDTSSTLTIKSEGADISRYEFEYPIPISDALTLLEMRVGHLVSKRRNLIPHDGLIWEVDVFEGENAGLVIAEVELSHEQQQLVLPSWVGKEITYDGRFSNSRLVVRPYRTFDASDDTRPASADRR